MDKKTLVIIFSLSLILIVSLSFVSAGLFSNLWGKITGHATSVCDDTDADYNHFYGLNYYKQGSLQGNYDMCTMGENLLEFYCNSDGSLATTEYDCSSEGKICQNGACVAANPPTPTCTDTDNGIVSSTYGICNDEQGSHYDTCYDGQINLKEYYCSSGACSYSVIACPTDTYCSSGECVQYSTSSTCADTDKNATYSSGKNYYKKGELGTDSDFCSGNILKEYFCSSGINARTKYKYYYTNSTNYNCSSEGKVCQNGACVKSSPLTGGGESSTCESGVYTYPQDKDVPSNNILHYIPWGSDYKYAEGYCSIVHNCAGYKDVTTAIDGSLVCRCDTGSFGCEGSSCITSSGNYATITSVTCVECDEDADCGSGSICQNYKCVSNPSTPTCSDEIQNQGEEGIDCGGPCPACQKAPVCKDSDNGINISVAGVVTYGSASYPDACINNTALNETVCFGFTLTNQKPNWFIVNCPNGQICQGNACIIPQPNPSPTCTDSDAKYGDDSIYVAGKVVDNQGATYNDYCSGDYVVEAKCASDGSLLQKKISCNGYKCSGRACNKPPESCEYYNNILSINAKDKFYMDFKPGEVFEAGPLKEIKAQCNVNFKSRILKSLPLNYNFSIPGMRIIKILNISADKETNALLNFTLNKSEIKYSPDIIKFYTWDKSYSKWTNLTKGDPVSTQDEYNFNVEVPHFSLFVIAEPELCGNGVFDSDYEQCDNTSNCNSSCMCEEGFTPDGEGNCTTSIVSTTCSPINATNCSGHNYVKCNDNSVWQDEGAVVGKCGVECLSGDNSCDGDYSLFCGTNYKWSLEGKIVGKCNYTSTAANLSYPSNNNDYYPSNGENNGESDIENGGTTPNNPPNKRNLIIFIIAVSLLAILVLFLLFKKLKKDNKRYSHHPGTPMRRTVSRTPPSRPRIPSRHPLVRRTYYPR